MITIISFLFAISACIFMALRGYKLKQRILWSLLIFVLSTGGFTAYILINGDRAPEDAVPITKEVLEKQGMTEKEWQEYIQKQQKSK